ncbi:sugar phosphate nucleotidyltransferase [Patescibacteria group bacterium]
MDEKKLGKARITITLRQELLPLIDRFVDGDKIRNRSHAIEYILGQHLGLGIQHVVIFAGADPETKAVTALTRVKNRPVIAYLFDMLKASGIRDVIMVIDEHGEELKEYLGDGVQWGVQMRYVEDKEGKGTAHALKLAKPYIKETFLLIYSDALADINLNDFVEHHQQGDSLGTVALTYIRTAGDYGVARMEGNKVMVFEEKPGQEGRHGLVNAGMYLFEPAVFDYIKEGAVSLENDVLPNIATDAQLTGYPFHGKWFDISKKAGRILAEKEWR